MTRIAPDSRHVVSVHEIVAKAADFEVPEPGHQKYLELRQTLSDDEIAGHYDTLDDLEVWAEEVSKELELARQAKPRDKGKIARLEADLKNRREQLDFAVKVLVALKTEAERLSGVAITPSMSDLELVSAEHGVDFARFTTQSAYAWLKSTFGKDVSEWSPPEPPPSADDVEKPMRADEKKNYQLIVAGLITLYLESDPGKKFGTPDNPNASQISTAIDEALQRHRVPKNEYSPKTHKTKLGHSLNTWNSLKTNK
jgi:hypothetical protein